MTASAMLETDAIQHAEIPPLVPEALWRNVVALYKNPLPSFVRWYQDATLGAIYRFRAGWREYTVLAGVEANLLLRDHDGEAFTSYRVFKEAGEQLHQAGSFISELDGDQHRAVRQRMQPGFTPKAVDSYVPRMLQSVEGIIREWKVGQVLPVLDVMQELVARGLGVGMVGHDIKHGYHDAVTFGAFLNSAAIAKTWPRILLSIHPGYLRAKRRMEARVDKLIEQRGKPNESGLDLLDSVHQAPGMTPIDKRVTVQLPFMAGEDTAAPLLGCVLYEVYTRPDVLERVQAEVDAAWPLNAEKVKTLTTLWSVLWETARLHPVFSGIPREAIRDFTFAGYRVPAGAKLIFATSVTHFLPAFFPEPLQFDLGRLERNEYDRHPGVFHPFALGSHACLGRFASEAIMAVILAVLLHEVRLELDPPGYHLKTGLTPLLRLEQRYHLRVAASRLPLS
jgi:cytochrome P450